MAVTLQMGLHLAFMSNPFRRIFRSRPRLHQPVAPVTLVAMVSVNVAPRYRRQRLADSNVFPSRPPG